MNVSPLPKLCIYLNGIQMIQFIFENFMRNLTVARILFFLPERAISSVCL